MDNVAQRLLRQINDLEQKATADTHYYRGCREGITLLLQEVRKAAEVENEQRRRQEQQPEPAPKRDIVSVGKKRKEAKSGANEAGQ